MAKKKDLKSTIEEQLTNLFADEAEPSEGRMKLLKLGIGYLAVCAKLEENEYGGFFDDEQPGNPGGVSLGKDGEKPATRRRKNGSSAAAVASLESEGGGSGAP